MQEEKTSKKPYNTVRLLLLAVFWCNCITAQTEFFNSKINFSEAELYEFYSSFSLDDNHIYFTGNDYKLHVYDKKTGAEIWNYYLSTKSNNPVQLNENKVFTNVNTKEGGKCLVLNKSNGKIEQTLTIGSISTKPFFKNEIMYCTGLDDGGQLMAYDLKNNKLLWKKFIAHGLDTRPYYFNDKIVTNAEGDNWLAFDYQGKLLAKDDCEDKIYLDTLSVCPQRFKYLNHKQKEISVAFLDKELGESDAELTYFKDFTILMSDSKIVFLDERNKIKKKILIDEIKKQTNLEFLDGNYREIFQLTDRTITFLLKNTIIEYDYITKKTIKSFDVQNWNPHQANLEENTLWLISKNDGELYGLELSPMLTTKFVRYTKDAKTDYLNEKIKESEGHLRTPGGFDHTMFYEKLDLKQENDKITIETFSRNNNVPKNAESYFERTTYQYFNPANIISISDDTENKTEDLGVIILHLAPGTGILNSKIQKFVKQENQKDLKWITEKSEDETVDEIGIVFLQSDQTNFNKIKKTLLDLRDLYKSNNKTE